jgi:HD superfamily phosphohydrolase
MFMSIRELPELAALNGSGSLIRIPNQIDVPVSDRVLRLIDTPAFQRLANVSQLGVVRFVYPGATHNRFEHSLGVYRNTLLFLQHLTSEPRFCDSVSPRQAELLILAALFHDVGHWPFAHPIEDIRLDGLPSHEEFAGNYLRSPPLVSLLATDWDVTPNEVLDTINRRGDSVGEKLIGSILSGPIDIDKMDYLYRDSLHAGVPYGQNFDAPRLIKSLCLNSSGDKLAITRKGKTAAELMVFARYVMFSEVYWHHAVRSATAMLQRAFFRWHQTVVDRTPGTDPHTNGIQDQLRHLFEMSENEMISELISQGTGTTTETLLSDLFGARRRLYKRIASFDMDNNETVYLAIARKPYSELVALAERLSRRIESTLGITVSPDSVLIDAPPVGLEVQFDVDVFDPESNTFRKLGDVSPVVKTLAQRQFDDFVKQVRVFVEPDLKIQIQNAKIDVAFMIAKIV